MHSACIVYTPYVLAITYTQALTGHMHTCMGIYCQNSFHNNEMRETESKSNVNGVDLSCPENHVPMVFMSEFM